MKTPQNIRLSKDKRTLTIDYPGGVSVPLSAELLRVESPSAEVQGHDPSQKRLVPGKQNVSISGIEPVGNYAVRLIFDDGHDTGIYSWNTFEMLATVGDQLFSDYLAALEDKGLSR